MIFNDFSFLFVFLPTVLMLFFMPFMRRWRAYTLVASSLVFYGLSGIEHALVLSADVIWVYFMVNRSGFRESRAMLLAAIVPPALALVYYKYLWFLLGIFIDINNPQTHERFSLFTDVILPAGISFFTFQVISFAIDRYRGEINEIPSLSHFAAYIMLFPQLVAGPILRYRDVAVPLRQLERFNLDGRQAARAVGYICLGLAVKVLIADTLSHNITDYRGNPEQLSQITALYTIYAYSFQIYFDFYGYSLIAIGLGALFGFSFPDNFKHPYGALNPREFWRRWHITLSFWIRDYLYTPMGGNNSYIRNIFIVMAICGLWHGAGVTFIVWGLYHACLVAAYHYGNATWDRMPSSIQRILTFSLVSFGWTLFMFDFNGVQNIFNSLSGSVDVLQPEPTIRMWVGLVAAAVVAFGIRLEPLAENRETNIWKITGVNIGLSLLFIVVLLFLDQSETFIYFRF